MKLYLLVAVALTGAIVSSAATRQVTYQGDLSPLNVAPTFDNGYLIVYESDDQSEKRISLYGPDGLRRYRTSIQIDIPKSFVFQTAAADTDGTVAVAFFDNWNSENFGFELLDPTGKQLRTVLTGSYNPAQICFAPDHTIWLAGYVFHSEDYMVFRRYSLDGRELGQFVPKSALGPLAPVGMFGGRMMRASSSGIVVLLQSQIGNDWSHLEWVGLDFQGRLIDRPGRHKYLLPWALAPDGTIYAREDGGKLLSWNRAAGVWKLAPVTAKGSLEGADENGLIFRLPNTTTFEWAPINR
jgi:hypothetical protein